MVAVEDGQAAVAGPAPHRSGPGKLGHQVEHQLDVGRDGGLAQAAAYVDARRHLVDRGQGTQHADEPAGGVEGRQIGKQQQLVREPDPPVLPLAEDPGAIGGVGPRHHEAGERRPGQKPGRNAGR